MHGLNAVYDATALAYVIATCVVLPMFFYILLPPAVIGYFYIIVNCCFLVTCIWILLELACGSYTHRITHRDIAHREVSGNVLCIIPMYLHNEIDIIDETLDAFSCLDTGCGSIKVYCVYNTRPYTYPDTYSDAHPDARQFENKWNGRTKGNVHFLTIRNPTGKSKADNLNFALDLTADSPFDYIGIFDADHHPQKDCILNAIRYFSTYPECDVVQGQCAVRNYNSSVLSGIIGVEFVEKYSVGHMGRYGAFGLGLFGGSNGLWRDHVLRQTRMNSVLTEDIDASVRATLFGAKSIHYNNDMLSTELAPEKLSVLYHQRMRWAAGWFEVSCAYALCIFTCRNLPFLKRIGLLLILVWRNVFVYLLWHPFCLLVAEQVKQNGQHGQMVPVHAKIAFFVVLAFTGVLRIVCVYIQAPQHLRGRYFVVYSIVYLGYTIFLNSIQVAAHFRHFMGNNEWVVTRRHA